MPQQRLYDGPTRPSDDDFKDEARQTRPSRAFIDKLIERYVEEVDGKQRPHVLKSRAAELKRLGIDAHRRTEGNHS